MKKSFQYFLGALAAGFTLTAGAAIPAGYYSGLEGKSGRELKAAAKAAVSYVSTPSYGDETWESFKKTDTREVNGVTVWWDMYSNRLVAVSTGHSGLNIEHSVPNSWWGKTKNDAYRDLHHLNPSDATANGWKSNYPLGVVKSVFTSSAGVKYDNGVVKIGSPASGESGGAPRVFEPADYYKGDFARAYFYIFTAYDDIAWQATASDRNFMFDGTAYPSLKSWAQTLLLEWAHNDPVDMKEYDRNNAVYEVQRNRNPFIDIPELADYIWGDKSGQPFHFKGEQIPGSGEIPDVPVDDAMTCRARLVTAGESVSADEKYLLLAKGVNAPMCMYNSTSYMTAGDPIMLTDGVVTSVPAETAVLTFEPSGSSYALRVEDAEGTFKGYIGSSTDRKLTFTSTPQTYAAVSITGDDTATISYGAAGTLQYNAQSPRFLTYTSSQNPVCLYVIEEPLKPVEPSEPIGPSDPTEPTESVWELVTAGQNISADDEYIIVSSQAETPMLATLSGTYMTAGTEALTITDGRIDQIPSGTAIVTFEEADGGWHVGISNTEGEFLGWLTSSSAKKVALSEEPGAPVTVSINASNNAIISYGDCGTLQFNASSPRFLTYTSSQQPVRLYRYVAPEEPAPGPDQPGPDDPTGVDSITADDLESAQIYDLNGRLMPPGRPEPGIYIVRTAKTAYKLIVR